MGSLALWYETVRCMAYTRIIERTDIENLEAQALRLYTYPIASFSSNEVG